MSYDFKDVSLATKTGNHTLDMVDSQELWVTLISGVASRPQKPNDVHRYHMTTSMRRTTILSNRDHFKVFMFAS